jgi:hypothetical protein
VSHEGPSEENRKKSYFSLTLFGEGWTEKVAEPTDEHASPPNKHVAVKVGSSSDVLVLTLLLDIRQVLGPNFGLETDNPDYSSV